MDLIKSRIILLNGTSSAGKSTLARALRPVLDPEFCYYASDQLADAHFRPLDPVARHDELSEPLTPFDVFWIGVHAPVAEIERRETCRADRTIGEGLYHLKTHTLCRYDLEVDSTRPLDETVRLIVERWRARHA